MKAKAREIYDERFTEADTPDGYYIQPNRINNAEEKSKNNLP